MSPTHKQLKEEAFEKFIFNELKKLHKFKQRDDAKDYNHELALDPELLFEFINDTQPEKMQKIEDLGREAVRDRVLKRIVSELNKRGLIDVLRKGVEEGPVKFDLIYFKPPNSLNVEAEELFEKNIWSVIRQVHFSQTRELSVDLVLFVNGLPIATCELKNEITGQTYEHAIRQYKTDRDPREPLFKFKRCAAHFAVDTSQVYVTTNLSGWGTYFLPFNKGHENGAGNPPEEDGHKTKYLWEEVWSPESWSELLEFFVHVFTEIKENEFGEEKEVEIQAFPRFHQRKTVKDILVNTKDSGAGKNYLIQHSAGSGKSMTIAWCAHRLAQLCNEQNDKIFDTIIVMTDRRSLDSALREVVQAFEPTQGFLETVDESKSKSEQLKEYLEAGARVITTTIQSFPVVADIIDKFPGKKFGLIVDEAHSSQHGETARIINEVLGDEATDEDWIIQQAESRQQPANLSYFAFTATPKDQTIRKFGSKQLDGAFKPFSEYTMKQAIEEGFIIDVLKNYVNYKTYFKVLKQGIDDPEVPVNKTLSKILRFVNLHERAIEQKIEIIVTHFEETVRELIDGNSKAMIVTRSREAAVRYKLAMDKYLKEKGFNYKTMVAFTDSIKIDGIAHTESSMNGVPEMHTPKEFKKPQYKFLIVAEKYQTGFDQPLLCSMYVDKTLSGVQAVQTLSRLNRTTKNKEDVFVLDFVNSPDDIKKAFDPYYTTTILSEDIDINVLNDLRREIFEIYKIKNEIINDFVALLGGSDEEIHNKANSFLDKVVEDMVHMGKDDLQVFKSKAHRYIKVYPFIAQVMGYSDVEHEKLYLFLKYLLVKLPRNGGKPLDILRFIDLDRISVVKKMSGSISLDPGVADVIDRSGDGGGGQTTEEETDNISNIINAVNKQWGAEFGEKQQETLNSMAEEMAADEEFKHVVNNNTKQSAGLKFESIFNDKCDDQFENDNKLWEQLTNNIDLKKFVRSRMFDYVFRKMSKINNE